MTAIALITTINVIRRLTRSNGSVVATDTGADHLSMVHRTWSNGHPGQRRFLMAGIAEIGTRNMIRTLAAGGYAIMTHRAIVKEVSMIYARRYPGSRRMTVITCLRGHDMRG